ncbi:MAG: YjjG family noncanonical pyrimidine nucleotidase [Clostridia bacterium]|nr:YjjG family noncanonical pyrimidine nucleotidase [Clostridia bacterium]
MKRLTLLIDADDTVLDFNGSEREAVIALCDTYGIADGEAIADEFKRINRAMWDKFELGQVTREEIFYTRFEILFEKFGIIGKDIVEVGDAYRENMAHSRRIIKGARAFLSRAYVNHDLYCVTNGITRTQKMRMAASGLGKYFKKLYISQEIDLAKPSKEFFEYVLSDIGGVDLSSTYIIGDSLSSDIQGGINSGIKTILFNRERKKIADVKPDYEVRGFKELESLIGKLSQD